ncbi:MAG: hypothetical protein R3A79_29610 [Nannocystaceae bacterium]
MPRLTHEALVQLVRNAPAMIPRLLWPDRQVDSASTHVTAAEFVDLNFAEYRADAVLLFGDDPKAPELAIVVEAQTAIDPRKRFSWPLYVAGPRARLGCPVVLVVLTLDHEVARWCAEPIDLGEGFGTIRPQVVGPAAIPKVTDLDEARQAPELAVLSVAAHADEPGAEHIALAALAAAHGLDRDRGTFYPDFVLALLGSAAKSALEQLMATAGYEYQSDFARKYFAEGKAEGQAEVLLKLLELKGFALGAEDRARILSCRDVDQLSAWVARVLSAATLGDVLSD